MIVKELELGLDYEAVGLKTPSKKVSFTGYILKNDDPYCKARTRVKRPAVLVCPGGGYSGTSPREAVPIALAFAAKGFTTFVLHYSTHTDGVLFPTELCEAAAAMKVIREHAEEWDLDEKRIAVCGFSAGGHLTASLGVFWNSDVLKKCGLGGECCRPDALILSYPVISSGKWAHRGSFNNLLGDDADNAEMLELTSLEKQVSAETPPSFIWHTWTDNAVPVWNSLAFATVLAENGINAEVHIYPRGNHGLSLGTADVNTPENVHPEITDWVDRAAQFIIDL